MKKHKVLWIAAAAVVALWIMKSPRWDGLRTDIGGIVGGGS